VIARARKAVQRHGPAGIAKIARDRILRRVRLHEAHVWYALDLNGERPRRDLPEGLELRRAATDAELAAIERLPGADPVAILRRGIAGGHELWMVADGDRPAFACWLQYRRAPLYAARGGSFELPADMVCLEDSVTSPNHRGRGIAPAAWGRLADIAAGTGFKTMITKVETDNVASRRAVEKAGFRAVATMRLDRRGARTRVAVAALDSAFGAELASRILA
jgi:RimJ/RimL family protein N-acetyltransferase